MRHFTRIGIIAIAAICILLIGCKNAINAPDTTPTTIIDKNQNENYTQQSNTVPSNQELDTLDNADSLWIITDDCTMVPQIKQIIDHFQATHKNISIDLQLLPISSIGNPDNLQARELEIERIRTAIMAGNGPDIFLMNSCLFNDPKLIPDPEQSMNNGLFVDISEYYDADTALEKHKLVTSIMDAGVVDNARYILPLRFDFPVAYVDLEQFELEGGSLEMLDNSLLQFYENILDTQNEKLASSVTLSEHVVRRFPLNFLSKAVDYRSSKITLSTAELEDFLKSLQTIRNISIYKNDNWLYAYNSSLPFVLNSYLIGDGTWFDYQCMYIGRMRDITHNAVFSNLLNKKIEMIPVKSTDGKIVADITYWGAIGYGCENIPLAYEFLREFLTKEIQWENNSDTASLIDYNGWPVYIKGDISIFKDKLTDVLSSIVGGDMQKLVAIKKCQITPNSLSILDTPVDRAHFATAIEEKIGRNIIPQLTDPNTGDILTENIYLLVEEWMHELEWYLAEG